MELHIKFNSQETKLDTYFYFYKINLEESIVLNPNKTYKVRFIKENNPGLWFDGVLYFNNVKLLHFGYEETKVFNASYKEKIPVTINEIKIKLLNYKHDLCQNNPKDFDFEFKIEEKEIKTNNEKDVCCICYEETFTSTKCNPVMHYICEVCYDKLQNKKCPYCRQDMNS